MFVIKRNGEQQPMKYDMITERNKKLAKDLNVDVARLSQMVIQGLKSAMTTIEIDELSAETAAHMSTYEPEFDTLAARIAVSNLHKSTNEHFVKTMKRLNEYASPEGRKYGIISDEAIKFMSKHKDELEKAIDYQRDFNYSYFGFKTLERAYLHRIDGRIVERPQHMLMRVAVGIHGYYTTTDPKTGKKVKHEGDINKVIETYNELSQGKFTHATPTLYNACSTRPQLSSCFLLHMEDDLKHIYETNLRCALISKYAGGIGLDITKVRAKGSKIHSTNGVSDGIVPMLKVFNATAIYANQAGKRKGSIACFCENTEVFTVNEGVKKIQDVKKGDLVITHKNRVRPVTQIHKNPLLDRKIYKLEVEKTKDIYVTGNHKFWSFYTSKYKDQKKSLGWNSIEELREILNDKKTTRQSCYISIPKETNIPDCKNYKIDVCDYQDIILTDNVHELKIKNNEGIEQVYSITNVIDKNNNTKITLSQPINKIWEINEDFANLIGIWLGDGSIRKKNKNGKFIGITFTIHKENLNEINFIKNICKKVFNCNITEYTTKNITQITINSHIVGKIFNELFGSYFNKKKLPNIIFSWPKNLIYNLVSGLITTDGHISKDCAISLGLSNEYLMNQLYHLLRNNGLDVSLKKSNITKGQTCNSYKMCIPINENILKNTYKLYKDDRVDRCYQLIQKTKNNETDTFLKIKSIEETDRKDEFVYTLGVEEDHSYTVEGLLTENCYLQPWHADVFEFLQLRLNVPPEELRARDIFLAMWIPDIFMHRVENNETWSLFCPSRVPELNETYGEEFDRIYLEAEAKGLYMRQVKARDIWEFILKSQEETGLPYMLYKDSINRKSNQKNIGLIRSSNLCTEIVEYTAPDSVAVCNLASIALPKFVKIEDEKTTFDYAELGRIVEIATENLNNIIDRNFYPVKEAETNNLAYRPIGLGVQGLADVFAMFNIGWETPEAVDLNRRIFETIYYHAVKKSNELALRDGSYSAFEGSPASQGILQYHMWNTTPVTDYDWKTLENNVKNGMRNSLLIAPMPTASTAQILGNNECFEPYTSNIYSRRVLAGDFVCVNRHLYNTLKNRGLWTKNIVDKIIAAGGSVQAVKEIPEEIRKVYKTVWEISQKTIIDMAADRGAFIDQTQSMNIFIERPTKAKLTSMHFYGWKKGLKTGSYYIRSKPAREAIKFTIDKEVAETGQILNKETQGILKEGKEYIKDGKRMICTEDVCTACSS